MQKYYKFLIIIALVLFNSYCLATEQDEMEIRKNATELMNAFNQHDPEKISSFWAEDGVFYHPLTGITSEGREQIRTYYQNQFAEDKETKIELIIDKVEVQDPDQAVEEGLFRISVPNKPTMQSAFKAYLTKSNGKWLIDEITDIELTEAPTNYEHLKDLEWLLGNWIDKDENVTITFDGKWDKYKNFLTQSFATKILGKEQLEGKQIIAWDPIKNTIRSWVFDSDGGFGEGDWEKVDNSWHAKMIYTLADGTKASATLIYTKLNDNSYQFSSVDRDVDGVMLPNIDPVTVERKQ